MLSRHLLLDAEGIRIVEVTCADAGAWRVQEEMIARRRSAAAP